MKADRSYMHFFLLQFECCGFESYMDYEENTAFQCGSGHRQACGVPWTCCKKSTSVSNCVLKSAIHKFLL